MNAVCHQLVDGRDSDIFIGIEREVHKPRLNIELIGVIDLKGGFGGERQQNHCVGGERGIVGGQSGEVVVLVGAGGLDGGDTGQGDEDDEKGYYGHGNFCPYRSEFNKPGW